MTAIPNSISVKSPDGAALNAQGAQYLSIAQSIVVTDAVSLQSAARYLSDNKAEQKRLETERRGMVDPLNEVVKKINGLYKPVTDLLAQAETIVKRAISTYQLEQDRIAREAAAKAEAEARKERERLAAQAERLAEKGKHEQAQAKLEQAASTVAVVPQMEQTKVAGMSTAKVWKAEIIDPVAVCRLIANGELPPTLVEFKTAELNRVASTWQNTRTFDGLRIYSDVRVASKS